MTSSLLAGAAPTHYEVLNLTPALLSNQNNPASLIKKAYHRALLRHHPDKTPGTNSSSKDDSMTSPATGLQCRYSIDQISTAYSVLADPGQRAEYDRQLRLTRAGSKGSGEGSRQDSRWNGQFQTGMEKVDLDDLAFDEEQGCWYRSCRCGNDKGYLFREEDLEEVSDQGELVLGCLDCSLWLCVHFAVMSDHEVD